MTVDPDVGAFRETAVGGLDPQTLAARATPASQVADDRLAQPPSLDLQETVRRWFRTGADGGITGDIGCGSGRDVDWLNRNGYPCVGFDASDALLAEARRRFPDWRFEHAELPRLDAVAPRTFDNVLCETVLMHLPREAIAVAVDALRRVLRDDGVMSLGWRVGAVDQRDERGRLDTHFDASLVLDALDGMTVLHSAEATSASSGERIHTVVARRTAGRRARSTGDAR